MIAPCLTQLRMIAVATRLIPCTLPGHLRVGHTSPYVQKGRKGGARERGVERGVIAVIAMAETFFCIPVTVVLMFPRSVVASLYLAHSVKWQAAGFVVRREREYYLKCTVVK